MIEAILWDNDGVLVDTEKHYFAASREALARVEVELSAEDFRALSLGAGESVFRLARERGVGDAEIESLRNWRNRRYAELLAGRDCVLPGVRETLAALHGRVRMAVVTSSRREHFEIIHRRSGLLPHFEFCLVREDYRYSKPHPEPYLSALQRLALPAGACLVVEDSPRGLQAAQTAGLACLIIASPFSRPGDFHGARAVLQSCADVPAHLA